MPNIPLRKAYKISCELTEKAEQGSACLKLSKPFDVTGALGSLTDVMTEVNNGALDKFHRNLKMITLSQRLRDRIQDVNNKPLDYAEGQSINQLISKQAGLKRLLAFYPENVVEVDETSLTVSSNRLREDNEAFTSNPEAARYRSRPATTVTVSGVSPTVREELLRVRLAYRAELEEVVQKLAYANITEKVEVSEEDVAVLTEARIPV